MKKNTSFPFVELVHAAKNPWPTEGVLKGVLFLQERLALSSSPHALLTET